MMISVILPTYNEAENIEALVSAIMQSVSDPLEIIVVDDDSPDGTSDIVAKLHMQHPEVKLLHRKQRCLATAVADGIAQSTGDIVIWMDADLSQPPALIPKLVAELDHHDIALASRYVKHGAMRASALRIVTSRLVNIWARLFLGSSAKDWTSGYIAVRRRVFQKLPILPLGNGYGEYFIAFLYSAGRANFSIAEIPYTYEFRKRGLTKTSPNIYKLLGYGLSYCSAIVAIRFKKSANQRSK